MSKIIDHLFVKSIAIAPTKYIILYSRSSSVCSWPRKWTDCYYNFGSKKVGFADLPFIIQ